MKKVLIILSVTLLSFEIFACAAITKKGTLCKRAPSPGSQYCWQHGGSTSSSTGTSSRSRMVQRDDNKTSTSSSASDIVVSMPKDERSDEEWTLTKLRFLDKKVREYVAKGHNPPHDLSQFKRYTHLSFIDQWGTPFKYNHGDDWYTLTSAGKDKAFGTEDDLTLSNRE